MDLTQLGLDIGDIVDPSGALDAASGLISLGRGDLAGAGISAAGILLPFLGDLAKVGKLSKFVRTMERVVEIAKTDARFAERVRPMLQQLKGAFDSVPMDKVPGGLRKPVGLYNLRPKTQALPTDRVGSDEVGAGDECGPCCWAEQWKASGLQQCRKVASVALTTVAPMARAR